MLAAVVLMLGCGEQPGGSITLQGPVTCYLGWLGELPYEGPSLQVQTCWNSKCSAVLEPTVTTVSPPSPESEPEETTDVPDDGTVDLGEPCEPIVPEGSHTRQPCAEPGEQQEEPTASLFPGGVGPGCGFDGQHSDFPVKVCARAFPGSTLVEIYIWPDPYTPGQGQDLLRDGDELSLHLAGTDGEVLADHTVTIDQYSVNNAGGSTCKSAGFTLDGHRL
jgi:hypothetical protein